VQHVSLHEIDIQSQQSAENVKFPNTLLIQFTFVEMAPEKNVLQSMVWRCSRTARKRNLFFRPWSCEVKI